MVAVPGQAWILTAGSGVLASLKYKELWPGAVTRTFWVPVPTQAIQSLALTWRQVLRLTSYHSVYTGHSLHRAGN